MISTRKKYLFLAMVILLTSLLLLIPRYNYAILSYIKDGSTVSIYTTSRVANTPQFVTQTSLGSGAVLECPSTVAKSVVQSLDNIAGISFCFEGGSNDIEEFLDKVDAVVLCIEDVENNLQTLLAYSPKLQNSIKLDSKTVNLQIAKHGSTITIGSPIILGAY